MMNVAGYEVAARILVQPVHAGRQSRPRLAQRYRAVCGYAVAYNSGFSSYWRVRSNLIMGWGHENFRAQWALRYYLPLKSPCYKRPSQSPENGVTERYLRQH